MTRMPADLSRRELLKFGAAALTPVVLRDAQDPILIAGVPAEISIVSISRRTVRVIVRPMGGPGAAARSMMAR